MSQNKTKEENKSLPIDAANELLHTIIAADQNVIHDYKRSDVVIRDLFNQCKKLIKSMEEYTSQYRNLPNDAGTKLLKKLLYRKDEANENGFCVVEYIERNGSVTTYLRHDAVVKELNTPKPIK